MRGGELILDLKNKNHQSGTFVKHPGIYDLIGSTRKPVRFCNVVADGKELRDFVVTSFTLSGTTYNMGVINNGDWTITISDTDEVSFISQ